MKRIGVYPVWENKFKISTSGRANPNMVPIACLETFSVAVDTNTEEWSPMEMEGWLRRMVTGKALTISLSGKRDIGDPGNDYVAKNAWATGAGCETKFEWEFPSGAKLEFNCVLNVTNPGGGDSRNVTPLEFEVLSDGKPVFIPKEDSNESGTDTPGGVRAYLYNGVKLPELPEVPSGYDKAVISKFLDTENYYLSFSSEPITVGDSGALTYRSKQYTASGAEWVASHQVLPTTVIWANHDVCYSSDVTDLAGTTYLESSDPVPLFR